MSREIEEFTYEPEPGLDVNALTDGAPIVLIETTAGVDYTQNGGETPVFSVYCESGYYDSDTGLSVGAGAARNLVAATQSSIIMLMRRGSSETDESDTRVRSGFRKADWNIALLNPVTGPYSSERAARQLVDGHEPVEGTDKVGFTFVGDAALGGLRRYLFSDDRVETGHINGALVDSLRWADIQAEGGEVPTADDEW